MGIQELQITVLGPSGTGKTTLLTAMYQQFERNVKDVDLELTPDYETSAILQDRLDELKSAFDSFESRGRGGLSGTSADAGPSSLPTFRFDIGKKQKKPSLQLVFRDYPGKYHTTTATKEEREFVGKALRDSAAVLIPIDTPALMEEKGKYHDRLNRPQQIKDAFKKAYKNIDSPRLIILAPVKCEKYLENKNTAKELSRRVKEGYSELIEYLESEKLKRHIASVITPIETVGGLVFSRIELGEDNIPSFYFRKKNYEAEYSPKDSEQPLRYLLRFLLNIHIEERNQGYFNFVREWFGADDHLKHAVEKFSQGCKTTEGFIVLSGKNRFNLAR